MATKKKSEKKKVGWISKDPAFAELGLRASKEDAALIQRAVESEAKRLRIVPSRNRFCLLACIAAAQKELKDN